MKRSTGSTDQTNAGRIVRAAPAHSLAVGGEAAPTGSQAGAAVGAAVPGSGARAEAVTAPHMASMLFTPQVNGGPRL
jgi:hypothetical protein